VREQTPDALERQVLASGVAAFELIDDDTDATFRGTIPFAATMRGVPNCLQCHQVADGSVLGAVTITMSIQHLKRNALVTLSLMIGAVALFSLITLVVLLRLTRPIVSTAKEVEVAVHRAIDGDFSSRVEVRTGDEIGKIGADMNRLLAYLNDGLKRISSLVAQLTNHSNGNSNLLNATIDMVETLSEAAHFKQAIEEDETKAEIYARLAVAIEGVFDIRQYSIYEILPSGNQMLPVTVDGEAQAACRWCDPQILIRNETCRARRTGHVVDGIATPGICFAFMPPAATENYRHICFPIMQSGAVGSVLQIVVPPDQEQRIAARVPHIGVYLREAAPVLEATRLMETLRESTLRDPMTGLHNRRFLEESVDSLISQAQRRKSSMAFMMLDLDYFKMVNDTYGHDAGDAVLKAVARLIKQSVRASDFVVRYGGEEFLILLQEAEPKTADDIGEKIPRLGCGPQGPDLGRTPAKDDFDRHFQLSGRQRHLLAGGQVCRRGALPRQGNRPQPGRAFYQGTLAGRQDGLLTRPKPDTGMRRDSANQGQHIRGGATVRALAQAPREDRNLRRGRT
jgi:GGDEF domain-containing protein/HAMP domain-containing protein